MNHPFPEVKKNFGFGCMRLPMKEGTVDYTEFSKMIDVFMENGFNYFDTAKVYLRGMSETALRDCLVARYPRESFILANKLTNSCFEKREDIIPLFEEQLRSCGVDYFDFYLMHSQKRNIYDKFKSIGAYEEALKLKEMGKFKHFAISFHDKADVLEEILTDYPEIEAVQIQFNYADYGSPSVESGKVYEVCRKHGKPVIVMEPVKGGSLVNLPQEAKAVLNELGTASEASYAIRYAASFEGVFMVLSGMGSVDMVKDNVGYMKHFVPLCDKEYKALEKVCDIFNSMNSIQCTSCEYCLEKCPKGIAIPKLFSCINSKRVCAAPTASVYYGVHTQDGRKASDCIGCGKCESVCPQHLEIRKLLKEVAAEFEKH